MKMYKIVLFKYLIIILSLCLASQNAISQVNVDSISNIISDLDGKEKLNAIFRLTYQYSFSANNDYHKYAQDGLEYALSYGDSIYAAKFLIELGYYYKFSGSYQDALNKFTRAVKVSENVSDNYTLGASHTGLGSVYHELGIYDHALKHHTKSLELKEASGNRQDLAVSYNNIGLIYYKIDNPDRALEYYKRSLKLKLEVGDTVKTIINYLNMGSAYSEFGDSENVKKSIESFKKAIEYSLKYKKLHRLGYTYNGIASVFISQYQYDSAKFYLNISIEESIKNDYKKLESSNYYLLAKIAFQEAKYNLALNYLKRSQNLLTKIKDKNRIKNNYKLYSEIFEKKNMMDSAFVYQKKFSQMKDSIFDEELASNLANVQIASLQEQNKKELADKEETISKGKTLSFFLLSILALSITLIVVIFKNYANTNKINKQLSASKDEIEAQKEILEKKNEQLADAQVTIQNQNDVLKNINIDLDKKVKERTEELDRSNHELEKAVKDLDQFIYKTSHDLRGPIATMQGIINLGVMDATDDMSKEYFNTLHKVSNNLNNVLFRLIEVHETYQKKPMLEHLDPMREIMETTNRVSRFSADSDITIITELQASGHWNSDKVLFNLIIENMLRSAMLYKDRGDCTIKISTEYNNEQLKIVFEDNGFGVQPGDEEKVFNIFFKGSPRPGGTGLEIYTAKIAVEKLGGKIILKKPIKNTIFEVYLPIVKS